MNMMQSPRDQMHGLCGTDEGRHYVARSLKERTALFTHPFQDHRLLHLHDTRLL